MRRNGFTLIEMMIVVAIIAIIAAIAIPNMLAARRAANEANAISSCKEIGAAQNLYHRSDWDGDGILEYVTPYSRLYSDTDASGARLKLISEALALAAVPATPMHGYYFTDVTADAASGSYVVAGNQVADYGICGNPSSYRRTGMNTYIMDTVGTVYCKDQGGSIPVLTYPASPNAAGWVITQ
jgi:prepilin-type N-terminal cleavage/methylation domain-containing protein